MRPTINGNPHRKRKIGRVMSRLPFIFLVILFTPLYSQQVIDEALHPVGMSSNDIRFRVDKSSSDYYRLSVVDDVMESPLSLFSLTEGMAHKLHSNTAGEDVVYLSSLLDRKIRGSCKVSISRRRPFTNALRMLYSGLGGSLSDDEADYLWDEAHKLSIPLQKTLAVGVLGLAEAVRYRNLAFSSLTDDEVRFLKANAHRLLIEDTTTADESEEFITRQVLEISKKIDYVSLFKGGAVLSSAVSRMVHRLEEQGIYDIADTVSFRFPTPWGDIILGNGGCSDYTDTPLFLVDVGGNDRYNLRWRPFSIIVDLSGNDRYTARGDFSIATGYFGYQLIMDKSGDDMYIGGSASLGCGLFGVGMLTDEGGKNRFVGGSFTQGAGAFGIGLLVGGSGNDEYLSERYSQGFGFTGGAGAMIDMGGSDLYTVGRKYEDFREKSFFSCLSQGFGFGIRDEASGGTGVLFDFAGNDVYVGDYFVQGSSYWYALGILYDHSGNDRYLARRYSQGAGTHLTAGILLDREGNDYYTTWGVSQGCGHDLSVGMLVDLSGNDSYTATVLSQGAGNDNGFGILVDVEGNDIYSAARNNRVQGSGNKMRGFSSLGLLLDLSGEDTYSEGYENNAIYTSKQYGVMYDNEVEDFHWDY